MVALVTGSADTTAAAAAANMYSGGGGGGGGSSSSSTQLRRQLPTTSLQGGLHLFVRRRVVDRLVMAGRQLWEAACDGQVDDVRRLLDQGVHPDDEYRDYVSAAAAAAGGRMC